MYEDGRLITGEFEKGEGVRMMSLDCNGDWAVGSFE